MSRLHDKGLIFDPIDKAKTVVLTEKGLARLSVYFRRFAVRR